MWCIFFWGHKRLYTTTLNTSTIALPKTSKPTNVYIWWSYPLKESRHSRLYA